MPNKVDKVIEGNRKGGKKKNPRKGFGSMEPIRRSIIAREASKKRWENYNAKKQN